MHAGTHIDTETHSVDGTQGIASVCCRMAAITKLARCRHRPPMRHKPEHTLLLLVLLLALLLVLLLLVLASAAACIAIAKAVANEPEQNEAAAPVDASQSAGL